jgi:hypothetical protein
MDLADVPKSDRATMIGLLPTGDLLMNLEVMKDTMMDLDDFSPEMASTALAILGT